MAENKPYPDKQPEIVSGPSYPRPHSATPDKKIATAQFLNEVTIGQADRRRCSQKPYSEPWPQAQRHLQRNQRSNGDILPPTSRPKHRCGECALLHGNFQNCPALGKTCFYCKGLNHHARCCRKKSFNNE